MENNQINYIGKKGVHIPQDVREEIEADAGTIFLVMTSGDTLILKKVEVPSKEALIKQLGKIAEEGQKRAEKLGIEESDVPGLVHKFRKSKK